MPATRCAPTSTSIGARGLTDGEQFEIGALCVTVVATPGHTLHHQSFVVRQGAEFAVFSGGSLLCGTVGRTDLLGADLAIGLAGAQWESVRRLLDELPGGDNCPSDARLREFLRGHRGHWSRDHHRERTPDQSRGLSGSGIVRDDAACRTWGIPGLLRAYGRASIGWVSGVRPYRAAVPALRPEDLPEMATGTWVVDVRPRADFAPSHLPGSINVGVDGSLAIYLGWTMPWGDTLRVGRRRR